MLHAVPQQIPAFAAMEFLRDRALIAASIEIETPTLAQSFPELSKRFLSKAGLVIPKTIAGPAANRFATRKQQDRIKTPSVGSLNSLIPFDRPIYAYMLEQ